MQGFLDYTDGIASPEIFRKWAAISAVAGALERRVWVHTARSNMYPNMINLLVAPPGVGKSQIISQVYKLWQDVQKFNICSSSVTRASLVDELNKPKSLKIGHETIITSPMLVCASELGVLITAHDLDFLNTINDLYDCPQMYRESRRSLKEQITIECPSIHMLGGTQPAYLAETLPELAWRMGFTARTIMIYAGESIRPSLFTKSVVDSALYSTLVRDLSAIAELTGEFQWTEDAKALMEDFNLKADDSAPTHSRLQHYLPRRPLHVLKLSMVFSVDRTNELLITREDVEQAIATLLEAESLMEQIFIEMVASPDKQVMEDLHRYVMQAYLANEKKPVAEARMHQFLMDKTPVNKIQFIIQSMINSGKIEKVPNTHTVIPRAPKLF